MYLNMSTCMLSSRFYRKPLWNSMIYNILAKRIRDSGFHVKFEPDRHVWAAILEKWAGLDKKFFCHFVDISYTGKVTKAFPEIPSGFGVEGERSAWGVILPPLVTWGLMFKVKVNSNFIKIEFLALPYYIPSDIELHQLLNTYLIPVI